MNVRVQVNLVRVSVCVSACVCVRVCMCVRAGVRVLPVGFQVLEPGLQVVEQVDLLAALGEVDVQQLRVVQVTHLLRGLARTEHTHTHTLQNCFENEHLFVPPHIFFI